MSTQTLPNLLLEEIQYKVDETRWGVWRRFVYPNGELFEEFTSHGGMFGLPMLHYTRGRCPETGKRVVARGVVAVGRLAVGILAFGHASIGIVAFGQLAVGLVLGLGQVSTGLFALGQVSIAAIVGVGQLATGIVAVGQVGIGKYVLAQIGWGRHVWDMHHASPVAVKFFKVLFP